MRVDLRVGDDGVRPYPLLNSLVVPRAIAWVSTVSAAGIGNLAPHSFFTVASAEPPVVLFSSIGRKDTLANIRETGEFVVNVVSEPLTEAANHSSARFDADVDEAQALGITMEPSTVVRPWRVAESPAALECTLDRFAEFDDSVVIFGEVVNFSISADALRDGRPRMDRLRPMSRLGGSEWGRPPEVISLRRPDLPDDIPGFTDSDHR